MKRFLFTVILPALLFTACEKDFGYRDRYLPAEEEYIPPVGDIPSDEDGLLFHENFQSWQREGYDNTAKQDCENAPMITATIMYTPSKPRIGNYGEFSIAYMLKDFAVNPECGAMGGGSTPDSDVSAGYVALQQLIFYECGQHDSDAFMLLPSLPSVGRIRFSVSLGGRIEDVAGLSLWKKSEGATAFTRVGDDFIPSDPANGEVFTVEINERNVQLKFIPALTGRENPVNDGVNRAVRIHDLWVWKM